MAGRVRRVHLVERHHQPLAEEPVPEAIDDRPGEELALGRVPAPASTSLARALKLGGGGGAFAFFARSRALFLFLLLFGRRLLGGVRLVDPAPGEEHHPRLAFTSSVVLKRTVAVSVLAEEALVARAAFERPAEEGLHSVEVVLLPVRDEGVVVTLGATDVDAEEGRADLGGEPVQVLDPLTEIDRGRFLRLVGLVGQHELAEDPVPRAVLADGLREVVAQAALAARPSAWCRARRLVPDEARAMPSGGRPSWLRLSGSVEST